MTMEPAEDQALREEEELFEVVVQAMNGAPGPATAHGPAKAHFITTRAAVEALVGLDERVTSLEASTVRLNHTWRCPRCQAPFLRVLARIPHPELWREGIEYQMVECTTCKWPTKRLYDPNDVVW